MKAIAIIDLGVGDSDLRVALCNCGSVSRDLNVASIDLDAASIDLDAASMDLDAVSSRLEGVTVFHFNIL